MVTIKSFTDISQSKKLSKILPLESADMFYDGYRNILNDEEINYQIDIVSNWTAAYPDKPLFDKSDDMTIPCWSLAALLDVLPNGIIMNKDSQNGRYHFSSTYIETYVTADNPVDACYEMILKLHELNML